MQKTKETTGDRQDIQGFIVKGLVWTFIVTVIGITIYRLLRGVDFVDEALYIVMPYRFALGAHPYVDEMLFHQTASLIVYPFMKLYLFVIGGTTGIALYMRFLYLVFMSSVGAIVWRAARKAIGSPLAMMVALMCPAFIYFNLPGLSYNTLGLGFLTAGSFLGVIALSEKAKGYGVAAGIAHGLAVMAYPALIGAVLLYAGVFIYFAKKRDLVYRYVAGGCLVAAMYLAIILTAGPANYWASYKMTSGIGVFGGAVSKVINLFQAFIQNYQGKMPMLGLLAMILILRKRLPWASAILMSALPLTALSFVGYPNQLQAMGYVTYLSFTAPLFYAFTVGRRDSWLVFWLVWLPGITAGLFSAYTSTTWYWGAALGFFQASIAAVVLLLMALPQIIGDRPRLSAFLSAAAVTVPVVILVVCQFNSPYNDKAMASMTSRISSGPYRGLYTSLEKRVFVDTLTEDIKAVDRRAGSILFFDNLPAGYLLTDLAPLTDRAWTTSYYSIVIQGITKKNKNRSDTLTYYRERNRFPDVIVKMRQAFYGDSNEKLSYDRGDPLNALTDSNMYRKVKDRPSYSIYVKRQLQEKQG